ncbi:MAG: glycosyltransferase family 25 protein [Hoeflea sp.]|uniref:glycosyltransferase family 25 protein n=1 Tax=Hoeflea sp. TaxID=1940281 RepID=UPI002730238F|nr:glycosyltransferase family 25 protein [Hoeflea sp.]MDP2120198.1 glycosyltransferase family 25 protein [Hoeflea sp.]
MNGTGGSEAFIIHLARAEARRPQVERLRAACPVPATVIEAVDGRAMSEAEIDAVYARRSLHAPAYPFVLTSGEVGCFLSHRKAWQAILEAGLEAGLVIEDDVEIDAPVFARALALARAHVASHGIVQFQVREISAPGPVVAADGDVRLTRPLLTPLRASCTLYSRQALVRLLDQTARFDRPVDAYMQMHWLTGLRPCLVIPSGVSDRAGDVGGTTIQARNVPLFKRLRREVLRPIYRARIRALSRANDRPLA